MQLPCSINTAIYGKKAESIDKKLHDFLSVNPEMNTYLQSFKYFNVFKIHYQKSPVLMLKNITKLTDSYMNLQTVHWMKRDKNFVLDCTFLSKKNTSQKDLYAMQKKITHRSPQKIQHLSFYSPDEQSHKVVSLNISGVE